MSRLTSAICVIAILAFAGSLLIGCSESPTGPSKKQGLVGAWALTSIEIIEGADTTVVAPKDVDLEVTWVFKADHTMEETVVLEGAAVENQYTWSTSGDTLELTADGESDTCHYAVSGDKLVLSIVLGPDMTEILEFRRL